MIVYCGLTWPISISSTNAEIHDTDRETHDDVVLLFSEILNLIILGELDLSTLVSSWKKVELHRCLKQVLTIKLQIHNTPSTLLVVDVTQVM